MLDKQQQPSVIRGLQVNGLSELAWKTNHKMSLLCLLVQLVI